MRSELILSIDQGTTNTKAVLIDASGTLVSHSSKPMPVKYPHPAWVEQDPEEIWHSVVETINDCLQKAGQPIPAVIAITNQRETVLAWERSSGKPLSPAIVWQCHRTSTYCKELEAKGLKEFLHSRTGLTIDPMFSGSKMRWLLDHIDDGQSKAESSEICLGTIDSWLLWNLTRGISFHSDYTNASRTQLFNLEDLAWDKQILEIFDIPHLALPEPLPSQSIFGHSAKTGLLPEGVPITCLIGDSHAALYGHTGFQEGCIKATYGTGTSLMMPTYRIILSSNGLSTTIAWGKENKTTYALEGNIYATGAAVQWTGGILGLSNPSQGIEDLAKQQLDSEGVYLVPAFIGLGAPYWNDSARGLISGLTRGTTPAHLARATLEAIAYQVRDVFDLMTDEMGFPLKVLRADGGASRNDLLMQFQSDMIGIPVVRNLSADVSCLGAAYLAGQLAGIWSCEEDIQNNLQRPEECFYPKMSEERRQELYGGWKKAIKKTILE